MFFVCLILDKLFSYSYESFQHTFSVKQNWRVFGVLLFVGKVIYKKSLASVCKPVYPMYFNAMKPNLDKKNYRVKFSLHPHIPLNTNPKANIQQTDRRQSDTSTACYSLIQNIFFTSFCIQQPIKNPFNINSLYFDEIWALIGEPNRNFFLTSLSTTQKIHTKIINKKKFQKIFSIRIPRDFMGWREHFFCRSVLLVQD